MRSRIIFIAKISTYFMRIYLDSNVFISFILQEMGKGQRGLFIEAEQFFAKAASEQHTLMLSPLFFSEVTSRTALSREDVVKSLEKLGLFIEQAEFNNEIKVRDLMKKGIHFSDAVHLANALANSCDCIVTFNRKDLQGQKL